MSNKPTWARLSQEEIQNRLISLQTLYNQKDLSNILGISRRSLNYYQKGESFPRDREVYERINNLYNRNKQVIQPEAVKKRKTKQTKRTDAQKYGRVKWRTAPIYPNYMFYSPAKEFQGVKNWDDLEQLSENGFVAGWRGRNIIPLEVQLILHGEGQSRFGKVVRIMGIITRMNSPKKDNNFTGEETELVIFPTYFRLISGLKKEDSFETRLDKIREFFFDMSIERGYPVALLGFYFAEDDES
jgi:transcriptional regulator with XRE-family HTH domain